MQPSLDHIFALFVPVVEALGLSLVDVEWQSARGGARLAVYIARPGGSVSIADCEAVTLALGHEMEDTQVFPQSYTLEVSSPGLDRVLKRPHEFDIFQGRGATLWLFEPFCGKMECAGILQGRQGEHVLVHLTSGEIVTLPAALIRKTKLVFDMK